MVTLVDFAVLNFGISFIFVCLSLMMKEAPYAAIPNFILAVGFLLLANQ